MMIRIFPKRPLPKGIFPSGNFPTVQFPNCTISQAETSHVYPSSSAQPPCPSQPQRSTTQPILAAALNHLAHLAHSSRSARPPIAACGVSEGLTYPLVSCHLENCPLGKCLTPLKLRLQSREPLGGLEPGLVFKI